MKIYLSSVGILKRYDETALRSEERKLNVLQNFYEVEEWMPPYIKNHWDFFLDSGAFSFIKGRGQGTNWDDYVESYAKFINENNIDKFFELDIDNIVGISEVERLRRKLENLTGKDCIPVWHRGRGKQYWIDLVKAYDYVALGGIAIKEIKRKEHPIFHWFLKRARENDCKVHGLGYTGLKGLKKYPFDSVDSIMWLYGNLRGYIYDFDGFDVKQRRGKGRYKTKEVVAHNFREWLKYQKYAEKYL